MEGSDYSTKEAVQIWRAWKTAHQMVADRVSFLHVSDPLRMSVAELRRGMKRGREKNKTWMALVASTMA